MARLKVKYTEEIAPALMNKFQYKSVMQIPKLSKVIVNVGCGESKGNAKEIEAICKDIATITGQKPITTKARKSVANFKVREGETVGVKVTLRGEGFPRGAKSPAPGSDSDANIAARGGSLAAARFFAVIGTAYGIWMLYSSGLELTFIACILYAPGILVYALGKKERGRPVFERPYEMVLAIALAVLALIAIFMIVTGRIRPF